MKNADKSELRRVIKSIPSDRLQSSIKILWQRYGPDVSYGTFRNYLRAFRLEEIKKINNEELVNSIYRKQTMNQKLNKKEKDFLDTLNFPIK